MFIESERTLEEWASVIRIIEHCYANLSSKQRANGEFNKEGTFFFVNSNYATEEATVSDSLLSSLDGKTVEYAGAHPAWSCSIERPRAYDDRLAFQGPAVVFVHGDWRYNYLVHSLTEDKILNSPEIDSGDPKILKEFLYQCWATMDKHDEVFHKPWSGFRQETHCPSYGHLCPSSNQHPTKLIQEILREKRQCSTNKFLLLPKDVEKSLQAVITNGAEDFFDKARTRYEEIRIQNEPSSDDEYFKALISKGLNQNQAARVVAWGQHNSLKAIKWVQCAMKATVSRDALEVILKGVQTAPKRKTVVELFEIMKTLGITPPRYIQTREELNKFLAAARVILKTKTLHT